MRVKLSLAQSSGKLDLSWMGLEEIPPEVFTELDDLEELTLAGNCIRSIPPAIANFASLKRLQAAGNRLTGFPAELTKLTELEEIWAHGNAIESLPEDIGALTKLWRLSLAGNRLSQLPHSMGGLEALKDLSLSGNLLEEVPAWIGGLQNLVGLALNGNQLTHIAPEVGRLGCLRTLSLQCNRLQTVPEQLTELQALEELNLSDNALEALPQSWASLAACKSVWLYGNRLTQLPGDLLEMPQLQSVWAEGNPLDEGCLSDQLSKAAPRDCLREIGLDHRQVNHPNSAPAAGAWPRVKLGQVPSDGRGYFKLIQATAGRAAKAVVVTFASAPGTPNWGGVLGRIDEGDPSAERCFDILYVVDGGRNWYSAGDEGFHFWRERLRRATEGYGGVVMLGDSMGATGALLFADLATSVRVFTPQVDLVDASMRPGQPPEWLCNARLRVLDSVKASNADIECHVGTWEHDLDQAKLLPEDKCKLIVHHVDSHRLAFALNSYNKLVPIIRTAVDKELGLYQAPRLANLL